VVEKIICQTRELIIPFIISGDYDDIFGGGHYYQASFEQGLIRVERNNKFGYMNINQEFVIPCKYENGSSFQDDLASVILDRDNGKINRTYIDLNGNEYYENFKALTTNEIISRIKECIKDAHAFSKDLGESTSIDRNYLDNCISDIYISHNEIAGALFEMKRLKEIEFVDNNVIILTKNYKYE
jgi:hypothetical protein